ncbi:MAG TPA: PorP/SprF family type IX secretion system membrane protein [Puia sp.]|nr:PorP/SprF family type IX secretion system membrane protein [Puia sp.]
MGKTISACWVLLLLARLQACPQDIHFSQFFEAPLLRNPALAGIFTGDYRVQGVYRNQWSNVTDGYRTGAFSAEYKMSAGQRDNFFTVGLQALFDNAGTVGLATTEILPALNYHKSLSDERNMYLSVGFMGGWVQKTIDRSKVTSNNQFDGNAYNPSLADGESFATPDIHYLDGSLGICFSMDLGQGPENNLFLGAAVHHLNRPKNSFYQDAKELSLKYVFSAGIKFDMDDYSYFTLQADHTLQGRFQETVGGCLFSYKLGDDPDAPPYTVHLGSFLRWQDALIPIVKLDMNGLSVALSYDVNISTLKTASQGRGGVELSVAYIGFADRHNSVRDKVLCPRF